MHVFHRIYSGMDIDRFTPSPGDSSQSQMIPGGLYAMANPLFQEQFNPYARGSFNPVGGPAPGLDLERKPSLNSLVPHQQLDENAAASAQRWFVAPPGNRLDFSTPGYDTAAGADFAGNAASLLSYTAGVKALSLANASCSSRGFGYYTDPAGWPSRSSSLCVPPTGDRDEKSNYLGDNESVEIGRSPLRDSKMKDSSESNWIEHTPSMDADDSGIYDHSKRKRESSPVTVIAGDVSPLKTEASATQGSENNSKDMQFKFYSQT